MKRPSADNSIVKRGFAVLLLSLCSAAALADDPCMELIDHFIQINANGYKGVIGDNANFKMTKKNSDNAVLFELWTRFPGEPSDRVLGRCKDRKIHFGRERLHGGFTQIYDGWLFQKTPNGQREMAGTFSHNDDNRYAWYGKIIPQRTGIRPPNVLR